MQQITSNSSSGFSPGIPIPSPEILSFFLRDYNYNPRPVLEIVVAAQSGTTVPDFRQIRIDITKILLIIAKTTCF